MKTWCDGGAAMRTNQSTNCCSKANGLLERLWNRLSVLFNLPRHYLLVLSTCLLHPMHPPRVYGTCCTFSVGAVWDLQPRETRRCDWLDCGGVIQGPCLRSESRGGWYRANWWATVVVLVGLRHVRETVIAAPVGDTATTNRYKGLIWCLNSPRTCLNGAATAFGLLSWVCTGMYVRTVHVGGVTVSLQHVHYSDMYGECFPW